MSEAAHILLIEGTASLQLIYESVLTRVGYRVTVVGTAAEGSANFRQRRPHAVVLDLMLPDRDGLDLMGEFLALDPDVPVIVITANGSINKAIEAMRAGAADFLVKPFDEQRFLGALGNAVSNLRDARPGGAVRGAATHPGGFIGSSPAMEAVYSKIKSLSHSMATAFITGESGTGKEMCAEAIHRLSGRAERPFVALDCGAIPADLLESEVFGHMKGALPGAIADKAGAAVRADGGTLFLDEICEMDPSLQTKLLRFLQTSTVQPVGSDRQRKVNVRIICATNRDPLEAVRRGQLREDLYYRLYVVPIHMPPLRERGDDVLDLAREALNRISAEEGKRFAGFDAEARDLLRGHSWPGNVRQLLNTIRQIVVMNEGGTISRDMLPAELTAIAAEPVASQPGPAPKPESGIDHLLGRTLADIERQVIEATIEMHGGSITRAARVLDVAPSTIYRKIESWRQR